MKYSRERVELILSAMGPQDRRGHDVMQLICVMDVLPLQVLTTSLDLLRSYGQLTAQDFVANRTAFKRFLMAPECRYLSTLESEADGGTLLELLMDMGWEEGGVLDISLGEEGAVEHRKVIHCHTTKESHLLLTSAVLLLSRVEPQHVVHPGGRRRLSGWKCALQATRSRCCV